MEPINLIIRQETPDDFSSVERLITRAFADEIHSDHTEARLVARLRTTPDFIPELSLIAEIDRKITGHILLSRILIRNENQVFESLAMAPVSVDPAFQKQGIGSSLIRKSHIIANEMGFDSVVLLGHADYYPRFGYEKASSYGIRLPFEIPDENGMVIALTPGALDGVNGMVEYPEAFFE